MQSPDVCYPKIISNADINVLPVQRVEDCEWIGKVLYFRWSFSFEWASLSPTVPLLGHWDLSIGCLKSQCKWNFTTLIFALICRVFPVFVCFLLSRVESYPPHIFLIGSNFRCFPANLKRCRLVYCILKAEHTMKYYFYVFICMVSTMSHSG